MPTYDYECKDCGAEVSDVFQKVTDPELTVCPKCFSESGLFKVITGGLHGFMAGSETIGGLADKNTKKYKSQINEIEAIKKENTPEKEKPFHHRYGNKSIKQINNMSNEQKTRYIMRGE
jgi:putative FmdB family regulatory protein